MVILFASPLAPPSSTPTPSGSCRLFSEVSLEHYKRCVSKASSSPQIISRTATMGDITNNERRELLLAVLPWPQEENQKSIDAINKEFPNLEVHYIHEHHAKDETERGKTVIPEGKYLPNPEHFGCITSKSWKWHPTLQNLDHLSNINCSCLPRSNFTFFLRVMD